MTADLGRALGDVADAGVEALARSLKKRGWRFVGADDGLRVHAGDGARERSPGRLRRARAATLRLGPVRPAELSARYFFYCRDRPGTAELRMELLEAHWSFMDDYADEMIARGPTLTEDG